MKVKAIYVIIVVLVAAYFTLANGKVAAQKNVKYEPSPQNNTQQNLTQAVTPEPEEIEAQKEEELKNAETEEEKAGIIEKYKQIKEAGEKAEEPRKTPPEVVNDKKLSE